MAPEEGDRFFAGCIKRYFFSGNIYVSNVERLMFLYYFLQSLTPKWR
jgi:hypothetical protein